MSSIDSVPLLSLKVTSSDSLIKSSIGLIAEVSKSEISKSEVKSALYLASGLKK